MKAEIVFKALSDDTRLKIVSILSKKPSFAEELSLQLNTSPSTISFHLKKLENAGIVKSRREQYYRVYSVDEGALRLTLGDMVKTVKASGDDAYEKIVEKQCFKDGRVEKLPVQVKKRLAVYKRIAVTIEGGRAYSVTEINLAIADSCDDFVEARKGMVAEGLLVEKKGKFFLNKASPPIEEKNEIKK